MNQSVLDFVAQCVGKEEIQGKRILEAGALDVNGSVRNVIQPFGPELYVGVDIQVGPGVDEICPAEGLISRFGEGAFDVVVSTEMVEHAKLWREIIHNLKTVVRRNGLILLTTRSRGFHYHGYPHDYWRYEIEDIRKIFSDCLIEKLEKDSRSPGVMIKARKPEVFAEVDLTEWKLYSVLHGKRVQSTNRFVELSMRRYYGLRNLVKRIIPGFARARQARRGRPSRP